MTGNTRRGATYVLALTLAAVAAATPGCKSNSVGSNDNTNWNWNAGPPPPDYWQDSGFTWDPPIDNAGDPGWQDSDEPWDPGTMDTRQGLSVWSHSSGVYALIEGNDQFQDAFDQARVIIHNDGTGWREYLSFCPGTSTGYIGSVRGFQDGRLIGFGGLVYPLSEDTVGAALNSSSIHHVFVVHDTLAYAAAGEKMLIYNGDHWEPVTQSPPHDIHQVWATEDIVYGVGDIGTIVSYDGTDWTICDANTDVGLSAIWGNAPDDIWVGSNMGDILHYDGQQWTEVIWSNPQSSFREAINGIWGDAQTTYFHTEHMLLKTVGDSIQVIGNWRCDIGLTTPCPWQMAINDIWGNSADELFLAVREDISIAMNGYDGVYILWFDGTQLHTF